jgi:hypothetical protein
LSASTPLSRPENAAGTALRLLVLLPHRDVQSFIEKERARLFSSRTPGIFSFPAAAPLALARRPLSRGELAAAARELRGWTLTDGRGGVLPQGAFAAIRLPRPSLFGPELRLPPPRVPPDALLRLLSPIVLCMTAEHECAPRFPPPFSACALANMTLRALDGGRSFEWRIGAPAWLPRKTRVSG